MIKSKKGYLCSPNMQQFCERMIALDAQKEAERCERPTNWGVGQECDLQRILDGRF